MQIDPIIVQYYSNKILEIVENREDMTQGDFQGSIEAVVMRIIHDTNKAKENTITRSEWEKIGTKNDWGLLR